MITKGNDDVKAKREENKKGGRKNRENDEMKKSSYRQAQKAKQTFCNLSTCQHSEIGQKRKLICFAFIS